MFKDRYTGNALDLSCALPVIFYNWGFLVFYGRAEVYWGKPGSVLWPAACVKGVEREEMFCGPLHTA